MDNKDSSPRRFGRATRWCFPTDRRSGRGNLIYESPGLTASLLGASFEAFVLDKEMLAHVYRMLRGIEVTEENLGFQAICDAVLGRVTF